MYQLYVYIPIEHKESVKEALFAAGAGKLGNYSKCSFETVGQGQFLPESGSCPALGKVGEVEIVEEVKLETLCVESCLEQVIQALRDSHPYEEPAFGYFKIAN